MVTFDFSFTIVFSGSIIKLSFLGCNAVSQKSGKVCNNGAVRGYSVDIFFLHGNISILSFIALWN